MRTRYIFAFLVTGMALVGCVRQAEDDFVPISKEMVFKACLEKNPVTKTVLQEDGTSIWWSTSEKINLFYGNTRSGVFTSTNTEPVAEASFNGTLILKDGVTEEATAYYWAVYPYNENNKCDGESVTLTVPSNQTAVEGAFANNFFPAVAKSKDSTLSFYNVCGGIVFTVSKPGIQSVTFEGNANEDIAGAVKVTFQENYPKIAEVLDGEKKVVLTAPDGGAFTPGKRYFIAVLPGTLTKGYTLHYNINGNDGVFRKNSEITITRSRFRTAENMDARGIPLAVDLGLSVYWADINLGATVPEDYGDYYAWGEVEPHYRSLDPLAWKEGMEKGYDVSLYQWYDESYNLTKYCLPDYADSWGGEGAPDGKKRLDLEDDAANVILGDGWRIPTPTEFNDLLTKCDWEAATENGVNGFRVSGNGNSIFLPAAGFFMTTNLLYSGDRACYWLSSVRANHGPFAASSTLCLTGYYKTYFESRQSGLPIRAVKINPNVIVDVESLTINRDLLLLQTGEEYSLVATITPDNATDQNIVWGTTNSSVASINGGKVVAGNEGEATITASAGGKSVTCKVIVDNDPNTNAAISFVDSHIKESLIAAYDANGDRELSFREAAAVSSLDEAFGLPNQGNHDQYTSFDEFQYFTGIDKIVTDRFSGWHNLASITLPKTITCIENGAFSHSGLTSIDIPNSVESIGAYAFHQDNKLKEVHLHNGLKSIGGGAFTYSGVERLYIDDLNEWLQMSIEFGGHPLSPGTVSLGQVFNGHFFVNGTELTEITIPEGTTEIKDNLFTGCGQITKVVLSAGISSIGKGAFYCCSRLESINLSQCKIETIGSEAFYFCKSLKEGTLPEGVTTIGSFAFSNCITLSKISIPKTVKSIGWAAYNGCYMVSAIYVYASQVPTIGTDVFYDTQYSPIYVPANSVEAYKAAENWSSYANRIKAITPEAVDLGLSVKWASFNLGGAVPEDYGDYYAWGEIEKKDSYFWTNYKFRTEGDSWDNVKFSKYNTKSSYGTVDNKINLDLEDDVAHALLGNNWRIPTREQWVELSDNCTWTETTLNGVDGFLVEAQNGNSIFLPIGGCVVGDGIHDWTSSGCYWSSTLRDDAPIQALDAILSTNGAGCSYTISRYEGLSIRAVTN